METNGIITKYRLMIEVAMTSLKRDMESDVTSVTIKNLSSYTKYNIKVGVLHVHSFTFRWMFTSRVSFLRNMLRSTWNSQW